MSQLPSPVEPSAAAHRLRELETLVAERSRQLESLQRELQELQERYFGTVGDLYAELTTLQATLLEAEIRAGIRPAPSGDESGDGDIPEVDAVAGCSNRVGSSPSLKKVFRDLAKAIHPDLAANDATRYRRHSLMTEANRAYAEGDEDRLRLILHTWERTPNAILDANVGTDRERIDRQIARFEDELIAIDRDLADVKGTAIYRLKIKLDDARTQGWDLMAEIVMQVRREASRAKARLASLRRR